MANFGAQLTTLMIVQVQGDEKAATKFQEASKAYETLKDAQKRALYDQVGGSQLCKYPLNCVFCLEALLATSLSNDCPVWLIRQF